MCTKARAEALGCTVSGTYDPNQLVPKSELSATIGNLIIDNFSGFQWAIYVGDPSYPDQLSGSFSTVTDSDFKKVVPLYKIPALNINGNTARLVYTNIKDIKRSLEYPGKYIYGLKLSITTTLKIISRTWLNKSLFINYSSGDIHITI